MLSASQTPALPFTGSLIVLVKKIVQLLKNFFPLYVAIVKRIAKHNVVPVENTGWSVIFRVANVMGKTV
jgi:hypothetical protein